jgi:hypothetical protein
MAPIQEEQAPVQEVPEPASPQPPVESEEEPEVNEEGSENEASTSGYPYPHYLTPTHVLPKQPLQGEVVLHTPIQTASACKIILTNCAMCYEQEVPALLSRFPQSDTVESACLGVS